MSDQELGDDRRADQDSDFDFKEGQDQRQDGKKTQNAASGKDDEKKSKKIDNQHFDEAVDLESEGGASEIESAEEDQAEQKRQQQQQKQQIEEQNQMTGSKKNSEDEEVEEAKPIIIPGAYNPEEYASLQVSGEVKELFKYITRYKPANVEIETKLKAFIPDYIPAVGEVDAFLKMPRPDEKDETLGLVVLDEPALNQSKKAKLELEFGELLKKGKGGKSIVVHSIELADKNPKEILSWINDVSDLHKKKQPPSVSYSKQMPDIDNLMQVWPQEIEDFLQQIKLPNEELDLSLADFSKLACAMLDIPIHSNNPDRNIIESLHVLFTLYSEFKANQHFQQNKDESGGGVGAQQF